MKLALYGMLLVLIVAPVLATGIIPARQHASLSSETQYLSVSLENTDHLHAYFRVSFSGDLADDASYTGTLVYLSSTDAQQTVPFSLSLPDDLAPGLHTLQVHLTEVPDGTSTSGIASLLSLVALVTVDVPAHGNFVSGELSVEQSATSGEIPITVRVVNKGDAPVPVWADFSVKNPGNEEVAFWSTPKQVIGYLDEGKIVSSWSGPEHAGSYTLEVFLHHGNKTEVLQKSFMVGDREVVPVGIAAASFSLGEIVPVDIMVRNKWNTLIEDVSATVFVLDDGQIVQSFKTPSEDIPAFGVLSLRGFWDTEKILVGAYELNVIVSFDGGQAQEGFPVDVTMDALTVREQATGQVTELVPQDHKLSLLIVLVGLLLIVNVLIVVFFMRARRR